MNNLKQHTGATTSDYLQEISTNLSQILNSLSRRRRVPSVWMKRLEQHFGRDPASLAVLGVDYPNYQQPCIHVALEHYLSQPGYSEELIGVRNMDNFNELLDMVPVDFPESGGSVLYRGFEIDETRVVACVDRGLYLVRRSEELMALGVFRTCEVVRVEVMSTNLSEAETFFAEFGHLLNELSIYRGRVISPSDDDDFGLKVRKLEPIKHNSIILPTSLLEKIERQTVEFTKHREHIRAAGLPLKRGILLHGLPGTGKTLTIRHLIDKLGARTTILVHGFAVGRLKQVCELARTLEPSTVVIEDVDLIAEDRRDSHTNPLLVDLLNEMDGLTEDSDILFVLTTNRPEVLEPALKSRPGRIDQAIEIPPPDAECRRRLFDLYLTGLAHAIDDLDLFIAKTSGATPVFIRELIRRAALLACIDGGDRVVHSRHLRSALEQVLADGSSLTKSIVGFHA